MQILYLQRICRRYLQRSNYLSASVLRAFCCRWQILLCFFNFIVGKCGSSQLVFYLAQLRLFDKELS
ncbi:hypothetical protein GA398_12580 [Bacteroides xylanisolvens]|uniref:Uncharacterized protein n=1 Tax=Bacteroides xylanisolvens TaxID=371601 RepID=A0A7J5PW39_9BACE|nr:hypothetical protein GA398_12580 [Bacteroides xylanisolvens]